jgi:hypothetical protein
MTREGHAVYRRQGRDRIQNLDCAMLGLEEYVGAAFPSNGAFGLIG